jgi:hypothetical protein
MTGKGNAPAATGALRAGSQDTRNYTSEDSARQRSRLLAHLRCTGSVSTLEARGELKIMHPAGRIQELRQRGYPIKTVRITLPDSTGRLHRVARYVLG